MLAAISGEGVAGRVSSARTTRLLIEPSVSALPLSLVSCPPEGQEVACQVHHGTADPISPLRSRL